MFKANVFGTRIRLIWLLIFISSFAMEVGALYYQYALNYGPCTLCVQIRAVIFLILFISLAGLLTPLTKSIQLSLSGLLIPSSLGFGYLCYQLIGIERGWFEGSCTFEPPFPSWIPMHELVPSVFEAWELCGYTPEMFAEFTMAEVLCVFAVLYLIGNLYLGALQARN